MIISLNDWAFVLGEICLVLGGYTLYRHRVAKRKKRHQEFLVRGEA